MRRSTRRFWFTALAFALTITLLATLLLLTLFVPSVSAAEPFVDARDFLTAWSSLSVLFVPLGLAGGGLSVAFICADHRSRRRERWRERAMVRMLLCLPGLLLSTTLMVWPATVLCLYAMSADNIEWTFRRPGWPRSAAIWTLIVSPAWCVACASLHRVLARLARKSAKRWRRLGRQACDRCGYPLRGNTSAPRCPECGESRRGAKSRTDH